MSNDSKPSEGKPVWPGSREPLPFCGYYPKPTNNPNITELVAFPKEKEDHLRIKFVNEETGEGPYKHRQYGYTMTLEKDPYGKTLKEPGSKADIGKSPVVRGCLHYFPRAISAVAELSAIGSQKYSWKGWATVPDGINRYGNALGRHELRIEDDFSRRDPDTGVLEATAVAWNALARLELILREQEKK